LPKQLHIDQDDARAKLRHKAVRKTCTGFMGQKRSQNHASKIARSGGNAGN
jgi:hypothetical protein